MEEGGGGRGKGEEGGAKEGGRGKRKEGGGKEGGEGRGKREEIGGRRGAEGSSAACRRGEWREGRRNPQGIGAVGLLPRSATVMALVGNKKGDVLHPKKPFAKGLADKLRGAHKDHRA